MVFICLWISIWILVKIHVARQRLFPAKSRWGVHLMNGFHQLMPFDFYRR